MGSMRPQSQDAPPWKHCPWRQGRLRDVEKKIWEIEAAWLIAFRQGVGVSESPDGLNECLRGGGSMRVILRWGMALSGDYACCGEFVCCGEMK